MSTRSSVAMWQGLVKLWRGVLLTLLVSTVPGFEPRNTLVDAALHEIRMDLSHALHTTDDLFIGVTLDASFFKGRWNDIDLNSPTLNALIRGLAPCYLRVGGTDADSLLFDEPAPEGNTTLTTTAWEGVHQLVSQAGWQLIMDVNVMRRSHGDAWDPSNAQHLLRYSDAHQHDIACFQLGNEPNFMPHKFGRALSAAQLAADYKSFQTLLHQFPRYRHSCLLGPETTKLSNDHTRQYFIQFLDHGGKDVVSAVTIHHYYAGKSAQVELSVFTDPAFFNTLRTELNLLGSLTRQHAPGKHVWLSETSSVSDFQRDHALDFASGFIWMDKLGLSAIHGVKRVIRQSLFYRLIDQHLQPSPDYFLTLLHKRLIQGAVLSVHGSTDTVRVYAHCTRPESRPHGVGSVTVLALNVQNSSATLTLPQFHGQLGLYTLTAGDSNGLTSKHIALNGHLLQLSGDALPHLEPAHVTGDVTLPPFSVNFIIASRANATACLAH